LILVFAVLINLAADAVWAAPKFLTLETASFTFCGALLKALSLIANDFSFKAFIAAFPFNPVILSAAAIAACLSSIFLLDGLQNQNVLHWHESTYVQ
jgi:hypothetical protein